jgi:hypothetical protein
MTGLLVFEAVCLLTPEPPKYLGVGRFRLFR